MVKYILIIALISAFNISAQNNDMTDSVNVSYKLPVVSISGELIKEFSSTIDDELRRYEANQYYNANHYILEILMSADPDTTARFTFRDKLNYRLLKRLPADLNTVGICRIKNYECILISQIPPQNDFQLSDNYHIYTEKYILPCIFGHMEDSVSYYFIKSNNKWGFWYELML